MNDLTEERKCSSTEKENNTLKIHLFDLAIVIN